MAATPALAEKARDLQFINGSLGRDAERQLQDRGFAHISTHKSSSGYVNSYWWDEGDDKCVTVEVYDGRVMTINDASDQDCGKHKGDDALAAVGVVAGAALLGSLFGHKSHHREGKEYNNEDTNHFERGYQDGLHNASYHNYDRSNAYSHGYEKGVDEREANLRHHHRRGGYQRAAQFKDLQGDRARGGMEALEQRGFRQVDNFASGETRYSIQWQPQTRQCLQVTIADGRFYDLRDIGRHPECR
ncbi:hypothetical protein [Erythrobacter sp. F6033]|uniref:hypothetical protein n=1 Tax=Erythrobacter sp. F6033 TaxID=2926401 RepID=UPI001FF16A24|nr:hypothetical protein [Erythrobacter sp. F6033]MCK0129105.1 hypothetical protein [Erythrobacter sp. F6033]